MVDDASCQLSCYISKHASIWHRYGDMTPQR